MVAIHDALPRVVAFAIVLGLLCVMSTVTAATVTEPNTQKFVKQWADKFPLKYVWSGKDICKYEGISCDTLKQTVAIMLPKIGLTGTIPQFSYKGGFKPADVRVIIINLMGNDQLTGTFPVHYGQLTQLQELYLMGTGLTGVIPQSWNHLTNLFSVDVSNTKACGNLPAWDAKSMKALQYMHFSDNSLMQGSIPASLATFGAVSVNVSGCNLCGCLPSEFSNSLPMMMQLISGQPQVNTKDCMTANACRAPKEGCKAGPSSASISCSRASVATLVAGILLTTMFLLA